MRLAGVVAITTICRVSYAPRVDDEISLCKPAFLQLIARVVAANTSDPLQDVHCYVLEADRAGCKRVQGDCGCFVLFRVPQ